jgi:putative ABC transport system permease protein
VEVFAMLSMHGSDREDVYPTVTMQNLNGSRFDYNFYEGSNPVLENEIALAEVVADEMKVGIGDTVYVVVDGIEREFILTGIFQSMSNQGRLARLNNVIEIDYKSLTGVGYLQGDFTDRKTDRKAAEKILSELYPDNDVKNAKEYISISLGGVTDQINSFKNLIILLVFCIDGLVTVLMMKTFLAKETAEIALLKSIGFRNKALRSIQVVRIGMIQLVSIGLGILLSILVDDYTIGNIFRFMGAKHTALKIVPLEVYVLYPLLMFAIPILVAWMSSFMVGRISIREMNGEE